MKLDKINLTDFQKRKFKDFYVCVYVLTKEIKIRTDASITDKELYMLFGIDIMGNRQILGFFFDNKFDNRFWLEKFEDFKARNLENILFFVTPQHKNIERCIKIIYNDVAIIHSPEDTCFSINKFFADHPSRKMQIALKKLFLIENKELFEQELSLFKEMYVNNKLIMLLLQKRESEINEFYQYDYELRKLFFPYYTMHEAKKFLNKLNTQDKLCTNITEIISFCLPLVNSFEVGRNYSKQEWLTLVSSLYETHSKKLEEYING